LAGEELYVRSYLGAYCRPDQHVFFDLPRGRWCRVCFKEEPAIGQCLLCDGPPEHPARLNHASRPAVELMGFLCRICHEAFRTGETFDGWSTTPSRRSIPRRVPAY
jgi:hypothetical protein